MAIEYRQIDLIRFSLPSTRQPEQIFILSHSVACVITLGMMLHVHIIRQCTIHTAPFLQICIEHPEPLWIRAAWQAV